MDPDKFKRILEKYEALLDGITKLESKCSVFFHRTENRVALQDLEQGVSATSALLG